MGTKEGVIKKVEAAQLADSYPDVEKQQFAKAKELLLFTLGNISVASSGKGFKVDASGSHYEQKNAEGETDSNNSLNVSIHTIGFDN
ncbi:MAG TPA: hypothetical protein VFB79_22615 [Candidatus Angelobacter sp.]|nr:hypothetical protein [Candidatus Angelobacter sp.]